MSSQQISRREFLRWSAMGAGISMLAACAPGAPPVAEPGAEVAAPAAAEEGTLRVYWHPGHAYEAYKEVIAQFEVDHPGWNVNWELYQWPDMRTKILTNFAARDVPDLVEEPGGWVQEFALAGNLRSLQPYVDADGEAIGFPDDWQSYAVERNKVDGEVYGVQLHLTCTLIFYNKELLDAAGITELPETWEEFLAAAQATTAGNVFGFAPNQSAGYTWPWFLQNGVRQYDPVNNVIPMDNEDAYEALQFQADMIHVHQVAPIPIAAADYEGPQRLFSARRAAFIITGPWDIHPVEQGSPDLEWGIAQALQRKEQSTTAAGVSLMIPTDARYPDLAWELLKRVTELDVEVAATKEAAMLMPRISWGEHPEVQAMDRVAPFTEGLAYAVDTGAELRLTGKSGEIGELFDKAYQEAIYENRPASEALEEYVEASNRILAS